MSNQVLDRVINNLEDRLKAAKELQRITTEFPELMEELRSAWAQPQTPANGKPSAGPSRSFHRKPKASTTGTHFGRVRNFFLSNKNQWTGTTAIRLATDLSRESVARVVYKSHKEQFESRSQPDAGDTNRRDWRLKPAVFSALMEESNEITSTH
jgi:hypothetical protein